MRAPDVNDLVRLTHDVPELELHRGEVGIVRSTMFAPATVYEVEFHVPGSDSETRALLNAEQVVCHIGDDQAMPAEQVLSQF